MKKNKELIILIPAYNEEKNIRNVIKSFNKFGDTIVVDDASKDKTSYIAKKYSKYYLKNKKNIGYDSSLRKGIKFICTNLNSKKYIITCDGDNQHNPKYIKKLIFFIKKKNYSLVIGSRDKFNRLSEYLVSIISRLFLGIFDPYSGMKAYKIQNLRKKIKNFKNLKDTIGLFGILLFNLNEIKDIRISVNIKNKKSSYGEDLITTFYMFFKFLIVFFRIIYLNFKNKI